MILYPIRGGSRKYYLYPFIGVVATLKQDPTHCSCGVMARHRGVASGGERVTECIGPSGLGTRDRLLAIGSTGTFYSSSGPIAEMRETSPILGAVFKWPAHQKSLLQLRKTSHFLTFTCNVNKLRNRDFYTDKFPPWLHMETSLMKSTLDSSSLGLMQEANP